MSRRSTTTAVLVTVLALATAGCSTPKTGTSAGPTPFAPGVGVVEPVESASPTPSQSPTPKPSPTKPAPPPYDVKSAQRTLTNLKYYVGPINGERTSALRSAVMAFQKVNGLPRDGAIGKATLAAMAKPKAPQLRATSPADRIEVDLTLQVIYIVKGGEIERIMPTSSGNGKRYRQKSGNIAVALSPVGWYKIERRIYGVREADLGTLYDPQYFYRGFAIHGSNSVPGREASHGCLRITRTDAKWMLNNTWVGMAVYSYGGRYTFPAGSSAPGTDNPTGDDGADAAEPAPSPSSTATFSPSPSPSPTGVSLFPTPTPTSSPSPTSSPTG